MATLNEIIIQLRADATRLQAGLKQAQGLVEQFGSATGKTGKSLDKTWASWDKGTKSTQGFFGAIKSNIGHLAAMGLGFAAFYRGLVLVNAGIDSIIGGLANYDENMRNVQSITKVSDARLAQYSDQLLETVASGRSASKSSVDLSDALYDVVSSGFAGQDALHLIEVAAKGAGAGLTTTKISAKVLVGVLNAFHLPASDADKVMSALFKTVDMGIITFEELSTGLGLVTAAAAGMGMTISELGAAITVLTRAGQTPSRSITNLNQVLSNMLKPSKQASDVAKALGIDLSVAAVEAKGFPAVLQDIADKAGNNEAALAAMFGDVRAIRGIFVLAANGGEEFRRALSALNPAYAAANAHLKALEHQQKSLAFQLRSVGARFQAYLVQSLRPVVVWLAQALPKAANVAGNAFRGLSFGLVGLRKFFADLDSVTNGFTTALIVLSPVIWGVIKALDALLTMTAVSPMGWVGIAVAGVLALGAAYSILRGKIGGAHKEATSFAQDQELKGIQMGEGAGGVLPGLEDTEDAAIGAGEAIKRSIIEPLSEAPRVADEARYELEKLSDQLTQVGAASSAVYVAEKAVGALYDSLAAINKAVEAENLSLIRDSLLAVGGSTSTYEAASVAVEALADSQELLSDEVASAREEFGALDGTLEKQEKTLRDYEREAQRLNKALDKAQERVRDLMNMPIAGEAAYKQATHEIDRQIEELQYALDSLADTPANAQRRAEIQRQISDLGHERSRIELEASRTIGEARHQMEMIEGTLTKEVAAPTVISALRDAVQQETDLGPAVDAANEKLEGQQTLVDDLKPAWEAAKERLDNLTSALGIIDEALDTFKSGLQAAADFAVAQFTRMQEAASAASAAAGGALALPLPALAPTVETAAAKLAEQQRQREAAGLQVLAAGTADQIRGAVKKGMQEARDTLGKDMPAEGLAERVFNDSVESFRAQFGDSWPLYETIVTDAIRRAIIASSGVPVLGATAQEQSMALTQTLADAAAQNLSELDEPLYGYLIDVYTQMLTLQPSDLSRLQSLMNANLEGILDKDQIKMVLERLGYGTEFAAQLADFIMSPDAEKLLAGSGESTLLAIVNGFKAASEDPTNYPSLGSNLSRNVMTQETIDLSTQLGKDLFDLVMRGWDAESALKFELMRQQVAEKMKLLLGRALTPEELQYWVPVPSSPPGHQHGVRDFLGGLSMLGEGGRELAFLPKHTSVASARDTARIMDFLKSGGQKGTVFAPQFDIRAVGESWAAMRPRILSMIMEHLDNAAAEAGINSPLVVHGVGMPRI